MKHIVSEDDLHLIHLGQTVVLTCDPRRAFTVVRVGNIYSEADENEVTLVRVDDCGKPHRINVTAWSLSIPTTVVDFETAKLPPVAPPQSTVTRPAKPSTEQPSLMDALNYR